MPTPYYCAHIGNKSEVFNGVKHYLNDYKKHTDGRKKQNVRINKIIEDKKILLELEFNKENKNLVLITELKCEIDELSNTYLKEEGELSNNNTKFMLDLCDLIL